MKRFISLLNIVLILGLMVTASAPPRLVTSQDPGGVVDDGLGGSRAPSTAVGATPVPEKQTSAQQMPSYMELVFMSAVGAGDWNIYDYKSEGATTTPLTSDPADDNTPRAAPGGGRVAFVSERDGNQEIYVVDFDGTNERRLTNNSHQDWYPSWSPSGNHLVFNSDRDGTDHEIYIMDVDDSFVTRLTYNDDWDSHPAYSPDGKKIVFTSDRSGNDEIWIMNADGTGAVQLTNNPADDWYPAWSPDGTQIAFTSWRTGDGEIFVKPVAGGLPVNLTNDLANDWAAVWAPDGAWIAFSSAGRTVSGDEEIFVMPAAGGAATNVSNNPAASDRYPDFFWPRIVAEDSASAQQVGGGLPWQQANTWVPPGVPGQRNRVLVQAGTHVSIVDGPPTGPRKVVRQLTVNGTLDGSGDVPVESPRGITVGTAGLIEAGNQWYTKKGCTVDLDAWPNGTITVNGTVRGGNGLSPAMDKDGGPVDLLAKNVIINGVVSGGTGGSLPMRGGMYGLTWNRGGRGGSATVRGEYITISGLVKGGDGGDTDPEWEDQTCMRYPQHGGDGGSVFLGSGALASYGGTRNLTVMPTGRVLGGNGGMVPGPPKPGKNPKGHSGHGGHGGDVNLNVQWGVWGVLDIRAWSQLRGGNGGGRPIDPKTGKPFKLGRPVWGGNGADVFTFVSFSTTVAGGLTGGARGPGEEQTCCEPPVLLCGADGFRGSVTTHPPSITFASTAQESGRNVWIYGGEDWGIDLSQVEPGAITATESITVAVGSGGQIDLRGHGAGENVLSASQGIFLYADQIQLDPGVSVADLTSPDAQVAPARVIYRGLLHAEGDTTVLAGASAVISLMLTNAGSGADTFQFAAEDTSGWSWQLSPGSLSLDSMEEGVVVAMADVPPEAVGLLNEVTFSARSTADPSQTAVINFFLGVTEMPKTYLPLVLRNYMPAPTFFDDFSDPNSGWPVGDYSNVATDYNNGNYRIQIKEDELFVWVSPSELTYPNGTFEVEAWRSTGGNSTYGIVFGLDGSTGEFYVFEIQPDLQQYRLNRRESDGWVTLIPYTDSSHINFNMAHNQLKVTRDGSQIELYVNDHHLDSYSDSTYADPTRRVGVYARSGPESPVWLRYDDFTVWAPGYGTSSVTGGDSVGVGATGETPESWAPAVEP